MSSTVRGQVPGRLALERVQGVAGDCQRCRSSSQASPGGDCSGSRDQPFLVLAGRGRSGALGPSSPAPWKQLGCFESRVGARIDPLRPVMPSGDLNDPERGAGEVGLYFFMLQEALPTR